jgi:hypothetical protein
MPPINNSKDLRLTHALYYYVMESKDGTKLHA